MSHLKFLALTLGVGLCLIGPVPAQTTGSEFTPAGQGILVSPVPGVEILYDDVLVEGFTSVDVTPLAPGDRTTPCGNAIQADFAPPGTDPGFVIYRVETTALIANSALVSILHPDSNASLVYAACEPPEINWFLDLTADMVPGDPRARVPKFSEFVVVSDLRPIDAVVTGKKQLLASMLASGSYAEQVIDKDTLDLLRMTMVTAFLAVEECSIGEATDTLDFFKNAVRYFSPDPIPNVAANGSVNLAGNLLSVAATLRFSAVKKCTPPPGEVPEQPSQTPRTHLSGPGRLDVRR